MYGQLCICPTLNGHDDSEVPPHHHKRKATDTKCGLLLTWLHSDSWCVLRMDPLMGGGFPTMSATIYYLKSYQRFSSIPVSVKLIRMHWWLLV